MLTNLLLAPQIFKPSTDSAVLYAYFQNKPFCGGSSAKIEFAVLLHTCQNIIPTSLFNYITGIYFKFAISHKKMLPSIHTYIYCIFYNDQSLKVLWEIKSKLTKLFNVFESDYSYRV